MGGNDWAFVTVQVAGALSRGLEAGHVSRSAGALNVTTNTTTDLLDELQFSSAKSIRTSIITLASFNVFAAAITVACILWDGYNSDNGDLQTREFRLPSISPSQVYPSVLSLGIVVQGIIFAVAQSRGLDALLIRGCVRVSQYMMPATFLVPFLQLVLGLETAIRALWRHPFPTRKKWVIPLCIGIVTIGLFALYGVTQSLRPPDLCYASLFWFTQAWRPVCLGLFIGIAAALLVATCVVFFRLRQGRVSSPEERVAASHMVYYMAVAMISNALLTPFFFSITFGSANATDPYPTQLSTVSSIVANLSGLMTGGLYLLLRKNKSASRISDHESLTMNDLIKNSDKKVPFDRNGPDRDPTSRSPSLYSPSDDGDNAHHTSGCSSFRICACSPTSQVKKGSDSRLNGDDSKQKIEPPKAIFSRKSNQDSVESSPRSSDRPSGPFAPRTEASQTCLLPATTYAPGPGKLSPLPKPETTLVPPPLFHVPVPDWQHNRDPSVRSLETVQIGIRISNVKDIQPARSSQQDHPNRGQEAGLPTSGPAAALRKSPGAGHAVKASVGSCASSLLNKDLPEVPAESPATPPEERHDDNAQLNPIAYGPQRSPPRVKIASPKGVGFQTAPEDGSPSRKQQGRFGPGSDASTEQAGWI